MWYWLLLDGTRLPQAAQKQDEAQISPRHSVEAPRPSATVSIGRGCRLLGAGDDDTNSSRLTIESGGMKLRPLRMKEAERSPPEAHTRDVRGGAAKDFATRDPTF